MKTLPFLTLLILTCTCVQAAPAIQPKDLSEATLKRVATDRQKASISNYNRAVARAEKDRAKAIKEAQKLTRKNDAGLKKTIQHHHLNTMLPPSERTPEAPRKPVDYSTRY